MNLIVRSPEGVVYETEDAEEILLPGHAGEIGVLPEHAALMTPLRIGIATVRREGGEKLLSLSGGFADIGPEGVTILADSAELAEEIDVERARKAKERAEQRLREAQGEGERDEARAAGALRRAVNRLRAAEKHQGE